jgi:hypothetical protein
MNDMLSAAAAAAIRNEGVEVAGQATFLLVVVAMTAPWSATLPIDNLDDGTYSE